MRVAHAARNLRLAPSLVFAAASMLGWLPRVVRETICRTFSVEVFSWLIYVFFSLFPLAVCIRWEDACRGVRRNGRTKNLFGQPESSLMLNANLITTNGCFF